MSDVKLFIDSVKEIALGAVHHSRPVNVLFGTVTSASPLEVTLDQKKVLTQEFLILSERVTDHTLYMEVNHVTEKMSGGVKAPSFQSHLHQYKGTKPFKVLNGLKQGERVILISVQGGQQYVVWDRIGGQR